jgi:type II secretion system protein H
MFMILIKSKNQKSFTLIELLLVLVLFGLFAGAAVPRLIGTIKDFGFNRDLANFQKTLRYAQYHAILEGKVYELQIDQAEKTYSLRRQIETENFEDFEPIKIGARTTHRLDEGTGIMSGQDEIHFFPDGSMTLPFRILLQSIHGQRVEITNKGLGKFA